MNTLSRFLNALDSYKVTDGSQFRLGDHNPDDDGHLGLDKDTGKKLLRQVKGLLQDLQELLYANQTHSLLIILQGMDAAGKDGTIKHVMSGVNPQGVAVTSFKQPGPTDLLHGFCGVSMLLHRRQGASLFLIAASMRMFWSAASTLTCLKTGMFPGHSTPPNSGMAATATSATLNTT